MRIAVKVIPAIFFASFLFYATSQAKVLYGVSYGSNRDFPGGDYSQFYIESAEECLKRCVDDGKCAAFSFTPTSQSCRLKYYIPKVISVRGVVSGYKLSFENNKKNSSGKPIPVPGEPAIQILSNTNLPGNDFHSTLVNNVKECARICKENSQCRAITFSKDKKRCWLKDRFSVKMYSPDHISGIKQSEEVHYDEPPELNDPNMEIMRKTDIPGGDYKQVYLDNARKCSKVCAEDDNCDAFTYFKSFKMCKLKSFQPKPIRKKGATSGIKR